MSDWLIRDDSSEAHYRTLERDIERYTMGGASDLKAFDREHEATPDLRVGRTFVTGATRDTDEGKLDWEGFISPMAMEEFASYMHGHRTQLDGVVRDSDNWKNGMPRVAYVKSLIRHTWDLWLVWSLDRNPAALRILLCAILFNVQGLLHELVIGRSVKDET